MAFLWNSTVQDPAAGFATATVDPSVLQAQQSGNDQLDWTSDGFDSSFVEMGDFGNTLDSGTSMGNDNTPSAISFDLSIGNSGYTNTIAILDARTSACEEGAIGPNADETNVSSTSFPTLHGKTKQVLDQIQRNRDRDRNSQLALIRHRSRLAEESDSSWDEQDSLEYFCDGIKRLLNDISCPAPPIEKHFVTDYLSRKKRRLVHALAHMGRFNHMTLDRTVERRILISTATISCKGDSSPGKCWNEGDSQWKLDPTTLVITTPPSVERDGLGIMLSGLGLPIPQAYFQIEASSRLRAFLAKFSSVGIAATVLDRLSLNLILPHSRRSQTLDNVIDASYRYWDTHTTKDAVFELTAESVEQVAWSNKILFPKYRTYRDGDAEEDPYLQEAAMFPVPDWPSQRRPLRRLRRHSSSRVVAESSDGYGSSHSRSSSKRSYAEYGSDTSQTTVLSGTFGQDEDESLAENGAAESVVKRRKRMPKQPGGYVCRDPNCEKVFDFSGERTKHERIHKPKEEYPHGCDYCEKRFIDKKDLKRHKKTHLQNWLPDKLKASKSKKSSQPDEILDKFYHIDGFWMDANEYHDRGS